MRNKSSYVIALLSILFVLANSCKKEETPDETIVTPVITPHTITDVDGNVYLTAKIGDQVWMAENLNVTHYRNGDPISEVTNNMQWSSSLNGAYCDYDLYTSENSSHYGKFYNWYALNDSRKIAPTGWHIPTDTDWNNLLSYLGIADSAGGKLKQTGTNNWNSPNTGATNSTGFTALAVGSRDEGGTFSDFRKYACFWSSTEGAVSTVASYRLLYNTSSFFGAGAIEKASGLSIRCVKD